MASTKLISPGIPNYTLKRNLQLNDNYISNDGGDEGISIEDSGLVSITNVVPDGVGFLGHLTQISYQGTSSAIVFCKKINLSAVGAIAGGETLTATGLDINCTASAASGTTAGTITMTGLDLDVIGENPGTQTTWGLDVLAASADTNYGARITSSDRQLRLGFDSSSYLDITVADDSHTTLATGEAGTIIIAKDYTDTTAAIIDGLHVDVDRTGDVSSGIDTAIGINVDVNHTGASNGTISSMGLDVDVVGDAGGTSIASGVHVDVSGANTCFGLYIDNKNGGIDFKNVSSADYMDYFTINTIAAGATTLKTVDTSVGATAHLNIEADGNFTVDAAGDITLSAGGGDITMDDGTLPIFTFNTANPTFKIIDDSDNPDDYFQIDVGFHGATTITTVDDTGTDGDLTIAPDGGIILNSTGSIKIQGAGADRGQFYLGTADVLQLNPQVNDLLKLTASGTGGIEISTSGTGDITIDSGGHVEFDGCAVGFDLEEETFSHDPLKNTGGTHDTQVDFRISNKIYLQTTASMDQINLIFPAVSGNFLLNTLSDGDWAIGDWKVWESDLTEATVADVVWPGGTQPDNTDTGRDIFSFYWDADNQICYGVASLAFAIPS